jgi:methionyl-tRNA synthetase
LANKIAGSPGKTPCPQRKLFVTTALPYANGKFHIGHIMEYIQADIWVRTSAWAASMVHFVGADDAHGAPIMIAAGKGRHVAAGLRGQIAAGRKEYLDGFHIRFDNWHSTDSQENTRAGAGHLQQLKANRLDHQPRHRAVLRPGEGHVPAGPLHQGRVPGLPREGPVRRLLRGLQQRLPPTQLINPYSTLTGATPELRSSEHFFFQLSSPQVVEFLKAWTQDGKLQSEVARKGRRMVRGRHGRLGHQPRRALLRHRGPDRPASTSTSGWTRRSATSRA